MKTLFEHEKATINYDNSDNSIELIWKKVQDEQTYKLLYTKGVEYLKEYKATSWLSDIRHQGVVGPGASKWMQQEIIPKAIASGLKKIAVVVDADVFKRFYLQGVEKQTGSDLLKHFSSVDAAKAWLRS